MDNFTAKNKFSTWSKPYRYYFFNNRLEPEPHRTGSRLSKDKCNLFLIIVLVRNDIYPWAGICVCAMHQHSHCAFSFLAWTVKWCRHCIGTKHAQEASVAFVKVSGKMKLFKQISIYFTLTERKQWTKREKNNRKEMEESEFLSKITVVAKPPHSALLKRKTDLRHII